ncbi:MAG: hypothetical protein JRF70_06445 [Deltaproteobacteria bacterium]|nr:hypothetical protein [Deltaproteobacteria bacterium]
MTDTRVLMSLLALLPALACGKQAPDPHYQPTESVLEVVAVLRRHIPDDTYRFPPAVDFTGRNVFRASLVRLENLELVHRDALRAGYMDEVISFAKGRSLERLRAFALAAEAYRTSATREGKLEMEALRSASVCDTLEESARIGFDPTRPPQVEALDPPSPTNEEQVMEAFERRLALLGALDEDIEQTHYVYVVQEETERADMARARWFEAVRRLSPDGNVRALADRQRLVVRHRESKNANRHMLALADLYAALAADYVEANPPEGLRFDPPTFQELVEGASRLYEAVANQDGTPEKLEAKQRLEAFLAFTLRVDRGRFTR